MTLTAETTSGFCYWFDANYFRKYLTDLREVFRIGSLTAIDEEDCSEIGL